MPIAPRALFLPLALVIVGAGFSLGCGSGKSGDSSTTKGESEKEPAPPKPAPEPELTQDQLAELYVSAKTRIEATTTVSDASFAELQRDLRKIADKAEDKFLRANASMLLGSLHEARADRRTAISYYRQAAALVPEEASVHAVLALALSADEQWKEAIEVQGKVVRLVPDDLQGWLLLGEMNIKGGDQEEAALAYTAYELRRKGLLDGLTFKDKAGTYLLDEDQRVACAEALSPAADTGTALGLMYALDSDPSAKVRASVAATMGEQRLVGYKEMLTKKQAIETEAIAKDAIDWALAEIEREPIETPPGPVPEEIAKQVEEAAKAQADQAQVGLAGKPEGEGTGAASPATGEADAGAGSPAPAAPAAPTAPAEPPK